MPSSASSRVAVRVFLIFSLGYFLSYLARGINLPLMPLLSSELSLSGAQLGLLTSVYLIAFALCQLPLGVLLDRFGPRPVQGSLLLLAAAGALVSSQADGFGMLLIGRLLLGIGTSGCLMAGLKAIVMWFAPERLPVLNGAIYAIGGLGSVVTGTPATLALQAMSWRSLFLIVSALILAASLLIWFGVPARRQEYGPGGTRTIDVARGIVRILRSAIFWRVAPLAMLSQGAYMAVQGLWAGPYLRDVEGLDEATTASIVTLVGWMMVVGAASLGWLARRLEMAGLSLHASAGAGMGLFVLAQVLIAARLALPPALTWGLFGLCGTAGILAYASLARAFSPALAGRVSTALNLLVFCGAFLLQYGIGVLLDQWPHDGGRYAPDAHQAAWWTMIALQTLALLWYARRGGGRAATA
ncbi:MAG: MFS transporter [Burkholderiaceae bacterium]